MNSPPSSSSSSSSYQYGPTAHDSHTRASRAASLRQQSLPPEQILWKHLRNRALDGMKFRRQHPVGTYTLDFFCVEAQLAIEVDGEYHNDRVTRDRARDRWLAAQNIAVLRIPAADVSRDITAVLEAIYREAERLSTIRGAVGSAEKIKPSPCPLPNGEGSAGTN